jgi:transcriptional regulator PpsR
MMSWTVPWQPAGQHGSVDRSPQRPDRAFLGNDLSKRAPDGSDLGVLSGLAPELAETFVSVASEVALVLDPDGTVKSVAIGGESVRGLSGDWVGRHWSETVTVESRPKIEQLLRDAILFGVTRRRQVNHPSHSGDDVPVSYAVIRLGPGGPLLAVGRDMRSIAAIQQRFVQSQLQMERDTMRRRQADTRYRNLFQAVPDAMLVLDADTLRIIETNGASRTLLDEPLESLPGRVLTELLEPQARASAAKLLGGAPDADGPVEIRTRLARSATAIDLSVSTISTDDAVQLLVRIRPSGRTPPLLESVVVPLRAPRQAPGAGADA